MDRTPFFTGALTLLLSSCTPPASGPGGAGVPAPLSSSRQPPPLELDLADWQLEDAGQLGHLVLYVTHQPGGDVLRVQEAARQPPATAPAAAVRSHPPSLHGGVFQISHFAESQQNALGGFFNTYARRPSRAEATLDRSPDGRRVMVLRYQNSASGFCGVYMHLYRTRAPAAQRVLLDASGTRLLTFRIRGQRGDEALQLRFADHDLERREDSLAAGAVGTYLPAGRITTSWQRAWVPLDRLPERLDLSRLASLSLAALGAGRGTVFLDDLALASSRSVRLPDSRPRPPEADSTRKAIWLWETARIAADSSQSAALVKFCRDRGVTDLFLQLPYSASQQDGSWRIDWQPAAVSPLLEALHRAGVRVDALDGHPRMALRQWHGRMLAVIDALIAHNRGAPEDRRFDGVRFDNEPYLLPHYGGVLKEQVLRQHLESLRRGAARARAAGMTFGADIPFWFDARDEAGRLVAGLDGRPVSELIIDATDNIAIMDYRTRTFGPDGVLAHAQQELSYAAPRERWVFVGLETVPLPDESVVTFSRRGHGSYLALTRDGSGRLLLHWIPQHRWPQFSSSPAAEDLALVLRERRRVVVPASKVTFQRLGADALHEVMRQARPFLARHHSFAGFAIHSYESYSKLR
jgi:hypothetical protein